MALLDEKKQFEDIKRSATEAISTLFPAEKNKHKLVLNRIWVEDNLNNLDYKKQADVKNRQGTWGVKVLADLSLIDKKTKKVIDREKKIRLMLLPKMTDRFSYIVKGNEYQVTNQLRLKSGAYVKQTKSGGLKTQINLAKGRNAELQVSDKGIVKMEIGGAKIPLYPILIGMGVSPQQIESAWGKRLVLQNQDTNVRPDVAVKRLASALVKTKNVSAETARDELKDYIKNKTKISPEMTKLTLGKEFSEFTPDLWLSASSKLVKVMRGDEEPDDVDSLAFKEFFSEEDSIKERILGNQRVLSNKIKRNLDAKTQISRIIDLNTIGNVVESFYTGDERSNVTEQTNPLHMYSGRERVTFMGPGGVTDTQKVTQEMRNVHPTHLTYLDPVHTPESEKIGLNLGLAIGAKTKGRDLASSLYDIKNKKMVDLTPLEAYEKTVAFPDDWDRENKRFTKQIVKAQKKGKIVNVPVRKVDYVIPTPQSAFTLSTNLIPYMASDNGNRTMMAGKHMEQAIALKYREEPLVQNKISGSNQTFEKALGESLVSSQRAPMDGEVTRVGKDSITIKSGRKKEEVPLYNNFALNQKTHMHHDPLVKAGDKVKKGQILAESNYTKNGVLALGKNLRVGYLPYKGYNFEDGIVITDSAAKKLTSDHLVKIESDITSNTVMSLPKFIANFPNEVDVANRSLLDNEGVIKKGSKVSMGDVLIAHMRSTLSGAGVESIKSRFHKSLRKKFQKSVERWNYEFTGKVVDVVKTKDRVLVHIRSEQPAVIGDKLAGRHGNKGIITKIIPDEHAPKNQNGEPVEVLFNPHGVVSRINIGQIYESAVSKAAKKKGSVKKIENFINENTLEAVKNELAQAGVSDQEELFDPMTNKSLGKVHVGNPYILKLNKQSEVNFSVRGEGGPTSKSSEQPIKGGEEGSKALDLLTLYTMLSHGSRANLKEMSAYKSENNPELWEAVKYGQNLPAPKTPFVFNKFVNMLKSSGVDVKKEGTKYYLGPLTDKHTEDLSKLEITKPQFITAKGKKRVIEKGGFVDTQDLGGPDGTEWGHIEMKEQTVNPVFEKAIASITGLKEKDLTEILDGGKDVDVNGKSLKGVDAVKGLLKNINVENEIKTLQKEMKSLKGTKLNNAVKKFRILTALKEKNLNPVDAYIRKKIPVIPPKMRPISQLDSGDVVADDVNLLYRDVGLINMLMKNPVADMLPEDEMVEIRGDLNKSIRALSGLEQRKIGGRDRAGFIQQIKGDQPKKGFFQNKVLRKNQNLVGRATIIPEPQLHMDEVQLPEKMAWKLYAPFATKKLIGLGMSAKEANDHIEGQTPSAKNALENAMQSRPVILNRAPSLHKFSTMAFTPKLTEGKAIKIPPLVTQGFNADFDGDTMTAHIPISDKAVREAHKMMPSRNLYKPGTGALMVGPSQESQLGFYLMSKTEEGRKKLNRILPAKFQIRKEMDKKSSKELFLSLSKELKNERFSRIIDQIKIMGEDEAYNKGFSLSLKDIELLPGKHKVLKALNKTVDKYLDGDISEKKFRELVTGPRGFNQIVDQGIKSHLKGKDNSFYEMVNSGARGSEAQLRQIVASPMIVQDPDGNLIPKAINNSYAEGLNLSDYWVSSYGARKGMMDRALSTQEPGVFNKSLMAVTVTNVVSEDDCGTTKGVVFSVDSPEILGRFTQGSHGKIPNKTIIDESVVSELKKSRITKVTVRSPLKCEASQGTCRTCYGVDENGDVVKIGDNIGAKAGQAISEPMQQMVMNTFHTGGIAGSGKQTGAQRVNLLLDMPKEIKTGKSTLAKNSGRVNKVEPSGLGGYNVYIDKEKHVTSPKTTLKVKKGDSVKQGDQISDGVIAPAELLEYKGVDHLQNYMTNELQDAYHSQRMPVDRKTFETVVRSVTNRTRVMNNPLHADYLPGDSITLSEADNYNKNRKFKTNVNDARGFILPKSLGPLKKGETLSDKEISVLKGLGIRELEVEKEKLDHKPYVTGFKFLPRQGQDWMASMGARDIEKTVTNAASQGWASDVKSYHPIPAYAFGADFGDDDKGRY